MKILLFILLITLVKTCDLTCDGADRNIVLVAGVNTFPIVNEKMGVDLKFLTRTYWSGDGDGKDQILGPTIRVKQGQSLNILLKNELVDDDGNGIGPEPPTVEEYLQLMNTSNPNNPYLVKLNHFYNRQPESLDDVFVDWTNMPKNFDTTNLHLHGLEVETHMYHPMGTTDPKAHHVSVAPGECYCYKFNIPDYEPVGMYWYHPHFHSSVAIQSWGGMAGLLFVDPKDDVTAEFTNYDPEDDILFPVWDPHFRYVNKSEDEKLVQIPQRIQVDDLISDQTGAAEMYFLVGGELEPEFEFEAGRFRRVRILCATTENLLVFAIFEKGKEGGVWDDAIPFYVISSDGVSYDPVEKQFLVLSGGQRNDVLVKFDQPGEYVVHTQGLSHIQFFGFGPPNATLAKFTVKSNTTDELQNIGDIQANPLLKYKENIRASEISRREEIVFDIYSDARVAPFPQFHVNGASYNPDHIDFRGKVGTVVEYSITNPSQATHPFHVHVNRFQVKEIRTGFEPGNSVMQEMASTVIDNEWRDTVTVPPYGSVRIWMRFGPYYGKTMLHCHFLAHEDTGMVASLLIEPSYDPKFNWIIYISIATFSLTCLSLITLAIWRFSSNAKADPYKIID